MSNEITLRDHFAMSALSGILSAPPDCISQDLGPNARADHALAAKEAYAIADAMLAARAEQAPAEPAGNSEPLCYESIDWQPLFSHMSQAHNLILTEDEMWEIALKVPELAQCKQPNSWNDLDKKAWLQAIEERDKAREELKRAKADAFNLRGVLQAFREQMALSYVGVGNLDAWTKELELIDRRAKDAIANSLQAESGRIIDAAPELLKEIEGILQNAKHTGVSVITENGSWYNSLMALVQKVKAN